MENTLFQEGKTATDPLVPQEKQGVPSSPLANTEKIAPAPVSDQTLPPAPGSVNPPAGHGSDPYAEEENSSPIRKILLFLIGIVFLGILGFGFVRFGLPLFSNLPFLQKEKEATLTYWGLWESEEVMKTIITDFEKKNPKIKVSYVRQDIKNYRQRLATRIPNGNGPDIFTYHNTWLPMMDEMLVPLPGSVMDATTFQKTYFPVVQQDVVKNGGIYGIPLGIDTLTLFVNDELVKAAGVQVPKNWDEFATVTRTLTVKDEQGNIKTAGASLGTFDNVDHAPDILSLLFIQNGSRIESLAETPENSSDALSFYTSFAEGEGNVWDSTLDSSTVFFSKGNLAFFFGYSWDIFTIKAANPSLIFSVHPVPHIPGRNMTIASYYVEGVSSKSKNQKQAMEFMKYLSQKEVAQKLYTEASKTRLFGRPYARMDLAELLKENKVVEPFVTQAKDSSSSYFASDTFDDGLNSELNIYLGNAVRSIFENTSPQTAIESLSQGVAQVLEKYGQ
jgi:multiple sugar transport system substrate-binding protein